MAWSNIIVESGAGVPDANSFIDKAYLDNYMTARDITTATDTSIAVLKAAEYLTTLSWLGIKQFQNNDLPFPRDNSGIVPSKVKTAQAWLACQILVNPELNLFNDNTDGLKVRSESVGSISTSYFAPGEVGSNGTQIRFDYIDGLLSDWLSINKIMVNGC